MTTKTTPRASFTILKKQMTQVNTAERLVAKAFFGLFYKATANCNPTNPYNKSLINLVCSVCMGKYCLRFLSHRPRTFVAMLRQYFPVQTSHSVNKSLVYTWRKTLYLGIHRVKRCKTSLYGKGLAL